MNNQENSQDEEIISLLFRRNEQGLAAIDAKYGRLLYLVAGKILGSGEDTEECVNDVYVKLWNRIPPEHPKNLRAYASRIARNLAIDRLRRQSAQKRAPGSILAELDEALPDSASDSPAEEAALADFLNGFLKALEKNARIVFVLRYYHGLSEEEIAEKTGLSQPGVHTSLVRTRKKLKKQLEKENLI